MANRPNTHVITGTSADVLNFIRNGASVNYRDFVPVATPDADSIRGIGNIILQMPELQNEFCKLLLNKIGKTIITSKMYTNPWAMFKKGVLEMGETVEEIFVNLPVAETYDPAIADQTVFKRRFPDVRSAFHIINYEAKYPVTIQRYDLERAFHSMSAFNSFITMIMTSLAAAAELDEFHVMKYCAARRMLAGHFYNVIVPEPTTKDNMETIVIEGKAVSNDMTYLSRDFNTVGVWNKSDYEEQYIIINSHFEAARGVKVLATAFNMSEAEYRSRRVGVDSFGKIDNYRLGKIFEGDTTFKPITDEEKAALDKIPFILVDREFFQMYEKLRSTFEISNPDGLYQNYFYHVHGIVSTSPFANCACFIPSEIAFESVSISPASATYVPGMTINYLASVEATPFAERSVGWEISGNTDPDTVIDGAGNLRIGKNETGNITVTAVCLNDETVSGSAEATPAGSAPAATYSITNSPDSIGPVGYSVPGGSEMLEPGQTSEKDYPMGTSISLQLGTRDMYADEAALLANVEINDVGLGVRIPITNPRFVTATNSWTVIINMPDMPITVKLNAVAP